MGKVLLISFQLLFSISLFGQDIIKMTNGKIIKCKVTKVDSSVVYITIPKWDNDINTLIDKSEVKEIMKEKKLKDSIRKEKHSKDSLRFSAFNPKNAKIYFRPIMRYYQSISTQIAPQYFDIVISVPIYPSSYYVQSTYIKEFSISDGFKYGGILGYKFNESIGIELGIEYFSADKTFKNDYGKLTTDWKFKSITSLPTFVFSQDFNKSALIGKVGAIMGVSWLNKSLIDVYLKKSFNLSKELCVGYSLGIEYNYRFKPRTMFYIECGFEYYSYTPSSAKLSEYTINGKEYILTQTVDKEIKYKDKIENLKVNSYNSNNGYYEEQADQDKPEVRIKETIRLNSVYYGIGVKFIIANRNEK